MRTAEAARRDGNAAAAAEDPHMAVVAAGRMQGQATVRSSRRRILPTLLLGSASTKRTIFGTL